MVFKKWFSEEKNEQSEDKAKSNKATQRLQSYITDYDEEDENSTEEVVNNTSHLVKPLLSNRNEILSKSRKALAEAEKLINNSTSSVVESVQHQFQQQKEEVQYELSEPEIRLDRDQALREYREEDIDYLDADVTTLLENLEEDPYADTEELMNKTKGKKYVEVTVVYDAENTIAARTYKFETISFTAFHENWAKEVYHKGTYTQQDVTGHLITINPSKCYTVEIKEVLRNVG